MRKGLLWALCSLVVLCLTACGDTATPLPADTGVVQTAVAATLAANGGLPASTVGTGATASVVSNAPTTAPDAPQTTSPVNSIPTVTAGPNGQTGNGQSATTAPAVADTTAPPSTPSPAPTPTVKPIPTLPPVPPKTDVNAIYYTGKFRPYFLLYPSNWSVGVENNHGDFADLPEVVKIGYPSAYNYGSHIYSGKPKSDPDVVLKDFLNYENGLHPIQITHAVPDTDTLKPDAAETFTTKNAIGPVTAEVFVYRVGSVTYLNYVFFDTPFATVEQKSQAMFIPVQPLTLDMAGQVPAGPPSATLEQSGSIQCPEAWASVQAGKNGIAGCDNHDAIHIQAQYAGVTIKIFPAGTSNKSVIAANTIGAPGYDSNGVLLSGWTQLSGDTWASLFRLNGTVIHYLRIVHGANNSIVSLDGQTTLDYPDNFNQIAAALLSFKNTLQ